MPPTHKLRTGVGFSDALVQELRNTIVDVVDVRLVVRDTPAQPIAELHPIDTWARASHRHPSPPATSATLFRSLLALLPWFIGAGTVIAGLLYVSQYGLHVRAKVVQQGSAAIGNLVAAKADLEQMDFSSAQSNFSQAYERFDQAHQELGIIGSGLGSLLAKLPGGGRIRAAQDLIEAGRLISDAGSSLSKAVATLSGSSKVLDPIGDARASLGQILVPMQDSLSKADISMTKAAELLSGIDPSVLPDDSRAQFTEFMAKLPDIRALIRQGTDATAFMGRLVGTDQPRRYLLLFQNSSELRPTGGFPGSYGLVTFEGGRLRDLSTDDIYNPDGQIKQLIVPPLQLQHITPSWGMRDANWFIDFPTSARKVMELYRIGGGSGVDGVIAIRPDMIGDILRITGPISLPAYDLVLTADNFLPTIQSEVESKRSAPEPKKIIMDLAPLILQKLGVLPPEQWARVLDIFKDHLASRDMLMYMSDDQLQAYIVGRDWDGRVKDVSGDYLAVNIANIKGAKEDAVTDTSVKLESWIDGGTMIHRLTLTRQNNGGNSQYGFYNKTNYSYVRVLVPDGSTLRGISGNDHPANHAMMDYAQSGAVRDPDLVKLESTYRYDPTTGQTTGQESGKTEFGFWMKIEPGRSQAVQVEYIVPARVAASDYHLYVQRQPGLDLSDFEFTLQKSGVKGIGVAQPSLTEWPDSWRLHDPLKRDLELSVTLK